MGFIKKNPVPEKFNKKCAVCFFVDNIFKQSEGVLTRLMADEVILFSFETAIVDVPLLEDYISGKGDLDFRLYVFFEKYICCYQRHSINTWVLVGKNLRR